MKKVIIGIVFLALLSACSTWNNVQTVASPICNVLDLLPFYDKSPREYYVFRFENGIIVEANQAGTIVNIATDRSISAAGAILTARNICEVVEIFGNYYTVDGK